MKHVPDFETERIKSEPSSLLIAFNNFNGDGTFAI